jgi:hypothetical protein
MYRRYLFAALAAFSTALVGCGSPISTAKEQAPAYDSSGNGSDGSVVDSLGFFVKLTSDTANITLHRSDSVYASATGPFTGNFSGACKVDKGSIAPDNDILCIAEVEELDLYFSKLTLQYHVPRSMCRFLKQNPYHFWVMQPGVGPAVVSNSVLADGTIVDGPYTSGGLVKKCAYDYSPGGPNCCAGTYQRIVTTYNASGPPTTTNTDADWGGTPGDCLSGPATITQDKTKEGIPKANIYYIENTGLNRTYSVGAAIDQNFNDYAVKSNLWAANFYKPSEHPSSTGPGSMPPVYPQNRPSAMRAPATYPYIPSDTYEYACFNGAEELQYRIRLMIREWNQNPITENCESIPGANCPDSGENTYEPGDPSMPINDRLDWRDVGNIYPGIVNI